MVKDFLTQKKDFLDKLWIEHKEFCIVEVRNDFPFLNQDYNQTIYYWVEKGKPLQGLPQFKDENGSLCAYVDRKTGEKISDGTILWEDCVLEGVTGQ